MPDCTALSDFLCLKVSFFFVMIWLKRVLLVANFSIAKICFALIGLRSIVADFLDSNIIMVLLIDFDS